MSLQSWKDEFYPIEAWDVLEKDALGHSIKKWTGLKKSNLKKHKIEQFSSELSDSEYPYKNFNIDGKSCALCNYYYYNISEERCTKCPLYKYLGHRCDQTDEGPYNIGTDWEKPNPNPMIKALKAAKKALKSK